MGRARQAGRRGAGLPDGADQFAKMEVAAEPGPDLRRGPAGGPPFAADPYPDPYPDPEQVLLVAVFDDGDAADDCAQDLSRRGLDVAVRLLAEPSARQEAGAQAGAEAGAQADEQVPRGGWADASRSVRPSVRRRASSHRHLCCPRPAPACRRC